MGNGRTRETRGITNDASSHKSGNPPMQLAPQCPMMPVTLLRRYRYANAQVEKCAYVTDSPMPNPNYLSTYIF
ncbi:MAG: hypothetical protein V7L25_01400 [Nostoc sp.]